MPPTRKERRFLDKPSASIATDETLVSQRSSNLLLFTRNLNAKHYNSEFRIHNSELSDAHKVSLRGAVVAAVVMHMLRFFDFHRR